VSEFERWYNNLYRGEKILVKIGIAIFIVMIAFWVTRVPEEREGVKKPIVINGPAKA